MKVAKHPTLNILVREDGCVYLPQSGTNKAHWTFGCKTSQGYRQVRINGKPYYVHRLVVEAFIQYPIPEGYQIDHINRDKSANFLSNLRLVSRSENCRNRADHDRVTEQGRTHTYEDAKKAHRERNAHHYAENKEKVREQAARFRQAKSKTHKLVQFGDGTKRWIPLAEAEALLAIPLSQRIYKETLP